MKKTLKLERSAKCEFCEVDGGRLVKCTQRALYKGVSDVLGAHAEIVVFSCFYHYPKILQLIGQKLIAQFHHMDNVRLGCVQYSSANELAVAA